MGEPKMPNNDIKADVNNIVERERAEEALELARNELEQRVAERTEALRESEARYKALFASAAEGIAAADYETKQFRYVNPAMCSMFGYTEEEFTRLGVADIHPKESLGHVQTEFEAQARGEKALANDLPCLRKNGATFYANVSAAPIVLDGRKCLVGFFTDSTERKKAEEAIAAAKDYTDNIIKSMFDTLIVIDPDGKIRSVNKATTVLLDYKEEELIGKPFGTIVAEEEEEEEGIPFIGTRLKKLIKEGFIKEYDMTYKTKSGEMIPVSFSGAVMRDKDGSLTGIVCVGRDLRERKKAEEVLRETTEYLQNLITHANAPIIVWDPQCRISQFNHAFELLTGRKAGDVIGKPLELLFPLALAESTMKLIQKTLIGERWESVEIGIQHIDGSVRTVLWNSATIFAPDGKTAAAIIAQGQDITDRKRAEEAMVESERKVRAIFDQTFQFIGLMTVDGILIDANRSALEFGGIEASSVLNKPFWQTPWWAHSPDLQEKLRQAVKKAARGGFIRFEATHFAKDGTLHYVDFSLKPVKDETGKVVLLIPEGRDITDLKNTEIALRESERRLKELVDKTTRSQEELRASYTELKASKDDLVRSEKLAYTGRIAASIAHEIRNPLTNVSMSIRQLKKGGRIKPEGSKHSEIIVRNVERINFLITELLNCARPTKLDPKPCDIRLVIKDALNSSKNKIRSQRVKVIKIFLAKPPILNIDKEHMGRVLLNLITNAVDAMPDGGNLTIATEINKGLFLIKVQDTGKGIPEKDIIRIFDPFFSTKPQGIGLGLTTCYGIVVSHGGTVEVKSKWRKGTTFIISVPITHTHTERERERESKPPAPIIKLRKPISKLVRGKISRKSLWQI